MTSEQQRIAIAEACGWFGPFHEKTQSMMTNWWSKDRGVWWLMPDQKSMAMVSSVPDYLNDLNAMHEAEKTIMKTSTGALFYDWLCDEIPNYGAAVHATAAQRAEAFLKAKGLWTEV